ncbi:MAG: ABC transporter permease [Solirubrobacteraceae bacterium]|jgi:ABC-type multidrug transport system permease subunit
MTSLRLNCAAANAVMRRDFQLFLSYRLRFISQLVSTLFGVMLFYYVSRLVTSRAFPNHNAYFAYVVVGLATMELFTATVRTVPTNLRSELVSGTFERMVVSPFGPVGGIVALALFPTVIALVTGAVIFVEAGALFGLPVHWATVPLVLPVIALGMLAFLPLTLLVAAAVLIVKQAGNIATFLITGLALAGGSFFPISVLPSTLRWIADVQPLTPALELARHELVGGVISGSAWVPAARLAAFAIVLMPLSMLAVSQAIKLCRARGTLIEY